jgi:hypothetical protein
MQAAQIKRFPWLGVLCGTTYGLIMRLLIPYADDLSDAVGAIVSISFIFFMPAVMGAITVWFATPIQRKSKSFALHAPWLSVLSAFLVFSVFQLETFVCLAILSPAFLLAASTGGVFAAWVRRRHESQREGGPTVVCLMFLPFAVGGLETLLPVQTEHRIVRTVIEVGAPSDRVWTNILNVPDIAPRELKWSFSHAIGLPPPLSARLIDGVREIRWERGIQFNEYVTSWEEGVGFSYRVDASPAAQALKFLDMHVVIGDRYFDVESGSYKLEKLGVDRTRVVLTTTYRISTRINFYGAPWADFVLDDFHDVVLNVVKNRSESVPSVG